MKKLALTALASGMMMSSVHAADLTIGVSMALFDDNFLTTLRNGIQSAAEEQGVDVQIEDAKNEVGTQLNQIQNFIASGVDAIIVNPVDTDATISISDDAQAAGIPLIYVNRQPINVDLLPDNQAFVASDERVSGTLQTQEVCRLMGGKGNVVVMMGELTNQAALQRTQDIHDVIATPECSGLKVVEQQTGMWSRTLGSDLMTNWISAGIQFDAVISNNDEMAIGAIQALKADGRSMDDVIVAGIDATTDALAAMKAGDLDVTVFQSAEGQGRGSVDAAVKLAKGEDVDQKVWVPFELVTPENLNNYLK
ncbi:MAG: rhizopine-binding protein [Marinomonas sp.]|jgi:inositol transport system substrate-binding protein|uniref:Monosaccharide ABC transporter substrate-binding protein (CUT2 family) n=1 Tax=Marinomonas communis TaxID=28254 RepID=A0A4R6X444_9GAMM|nr:sugar ABC transporter substrate-binding protein [Marinomonas communis]MAF16352.1 rhizopine-binding protein [Marinomonas sp.]MEC8482259.1 sugar ABC transporter substrate-binding protein [Pseudomonadota bacterium]MCC4273233.1 sugar ABC transporter substrate-binding protein [Marinomonas communis]RUM52928.1 MAG: rhizopine-binding protein [Marinomonas sp.]RUM57420.1 MAG: rhizopine-binding protein [Marinomonas sp.]|tara:strand:- start:235 stop:1161 length:927 start_codon:yes stop_codon:yes gene_type:complete